MPRVSITSSSCLENSDAFTLLTAITTARTSLPITIGVASRFWVTYPVCLSMKSEKWLFWKNAHTFAKQHRTMECGSRNGSRSFRLFQILSTGNRDPSAVVLSKHPPSYDCIEQNCPFQRERFPAELWPIQVRLRLGQEKRGDATAKWIEDAKRKGGKDYRLQWTESVWRQGKHSWGYRCVSQSSQK